MRRRCGLSIAFGASAIAVLGCLTAAIAGVPVALAQSSGPLDFLAADELPQQTILMVALAGAMVFAVFSTISLMRARDRAEALNARLLQQIGNLQGDIDRAEALVGETGQRLVAWSDSDATTLTAGSLPVEAGVPTDETAFLSFESWLVPESANRLLGLVAALRTRGISFTETLHTAAGRMIEARGWSTGGTGAVRFRDLTGDRMALAEVQTRHDRLVARVDAMRDMLSAAPLPVWLRDREGRLAWVNQAYAAAVEAPDPAAAVAAGQELFDAVGRQAIAEAHRRDVMYAGRLPAIVGGARRVFDVTDIVADDGNAGMGIDATVAETAQAALRREVEFNARTLDQLQTAVAIFGPDRRMRSYNAAYRALFDLDAAFLESAPDEAAVLERLRTGRKIPEQVDFRDWRSKLLSAYQSTEAQEFQWHLPDGRTFRVIANPHPGGGMTWIYENVTERLDLESRYNVLKSFQGETLDQLAEGVAVFGSDGRLRLYNPAFAEIFSLESAMLDALPHVSDVVAACHEPDGDAEVWRRFTASIAGLDESRSTHAGRVQRSDGRVIDYGTTPLPDGQTMVTFVDVTDSANVEKALVERNEALEAADRLKNAFIRHVSYELRSPLTNIIGFAQLLTDARVGPLNDKQGEYLSYVLSSSASLLAIINDILDLTTVDAGVMELDISEVGVAALVDEAVAEVADRIAEKRIQLEVSVPPGLGRFVVDERRIRQVLFNILTNAVDYSDDGGRVAVSVARDDHAVKFEIRDEGAGIPGDFLDTAFERFSSMARGNSRGGAGLGLAIVKSFVDLHGGTVRIDSVDGEGSTVRMNLPLRPRIAANAAE